MKKLLFALSISSALTSTSLTGGAYAADLGGLKDGYDAAPGISVNWTGIYFGGQVGYGNANHNLTLEEQVAKKGTEEGTTNYETFASAFIDGINSSGAFGGLTVGGDIQRGNFLFGVFADYNFSGLETNAGVQVKGTSLIDASIEEDASWLVAARVGYLFGQEKRALLYGLAGYGQTDVDYKLGVGDLSASKSLTFSGFVVGAGGEYALTRNVFLGIEYQHFFGGEEELFNSDPKGIDCDRLVVTDEMDTDKVMAKLKVKLGGDSF